MFLILRKIVIFLSKKIIILVLYLSYVFDILLLIGYFAAHRLRIKIVLFFSKRILILVLYFVLWKLYQYLSFPSSKEGILFITLSKFRS